MTPVTNTQQSSWIRKIMPSSKTAAKAIGVIGLGTLLYDAHHWGKLKSSEHRNIQDGNAGLRYFLNTQYNTNQSHATAKLKNMMFRYSLGNRLRGDCNSIVGYAKGGLQSLVDGIIPLAASVVAIKAKGATSKLAGAVVAGWGALSFLRHGCRNLFGNKGI